MVTQIKFLNSNPVISVRSLFQFLSHCALQVDCVLQRPLSIA